MFLTRLGFGSKVVVTGDVTQIDLPAATRRSGLIHVREILGGVDGIEFVEFGNQDVVRHKLVQRIVEAYKRHAEETGTQRAPVIDVEVDNRSGRRPSTRTGGASRCAPTRRSPPRASTSGELGVALRRRGARSGALKREHLGDRRGRPTSSPSRSTAATSCRTASRASSATSSSARRSSASAWRRPLVHGLLHLLGYEHGNGDGAREERSHEDMTAACPERETPREPGARAARLAVQSFNYAFEGVIHVLRTQRNMRIHFAVATAVLDPRVRLRRHEARADRARCSRSRSCSSPR